MATRGSKLSRMVEWFKSADIEEANYVLGRALAIVNERKGAKVASQPVVRKRRARKVQPETTVTEHETIANA